MIIWTDYMKYRARWRGFDLAVVERIVRFSDEKYVDLANGRAVAVGRHGDSLLLIPFETDGANIIPVTVHRTTRQQVNVRLKSGRYAHG
jgi:hypothetical protein